jgi:hypothetical protein
VCFCSPAHFTVPYRANFALGWSRAKRKFAGVQSLRPSAKAGIVVGGFAAAFAVAWVAVEIRQRLTQGPEAQASAGMYAFGDLVLGVFVFGVLALVPLGLALYWLRPVAHFWTNLTRGAVLFALTGPLALIVSGWLRQSAGNWAIASDARFGLMPLTALAMSVCGLFAPQPKLRWVLIGAALVEGSLFAAVVLVKFVLPRH